MPNINININININNNCRILLFAAGLLAVSSSSHASSLGSAEGNIANIASLVQVCSEVYPQQNLPVKAVLQAMIRGTLGEGLAGEIKYRQLLSNAEYREHMSSAIADLKRQRSQGKLDLRKACLAN